MTAGSFARQEVRVTEPNASYVAALYRVQKKRINCFIKNLFPNFIYYWFFKIIEEL